MQFSLWIIDNFNKYVRVVPLKDIKGVTVAKTFQKVSNESNRKPNKIWVDKGSEFYNRSIKWCLQDNDVEIHSTYNAGKSIVAKRLMWTLNNKIYKYITSALKTIYLLINKMLKLINTAIHIKAQIKWSILM